MARKDVQGLQESVDNVVIDEARVPDHREPTEVLHRQRNSAVDANRSCDLLVLIPPLQPTRVVCVDLAVDAHLPIQRQRLNCDNSRRHVLRCEI